MQQPSASNNSHTRGSTPITNHSVYTNIGSSFQSNNTLHMPQIHIPLPDYVQPMMQSYYHPPLVLQQEPMANPMLIQLITDNKYLQQTLM